MSRFLLMFHRQPREESLTTLLPYRSETGPIVLGARPARPGGYTLFWARPGGRWTEFGTLRPAEGERQDGSISFDPVRNQLPWLEQYPVVVRMREPAYAQARRSRS